MLPLGIVVMTLVFLIFLTYFYGQIGNISDKIKTGDARMVEDAIRNAAVTCYAIEGCYPESLEYIEEHYGVVIDRERYYVDYQAFFSNRMPQIAVYTVDTE